MVAVTTHAAYSHQIMMRGCLKSVFSMRINSMILSFPSCGSFKFVNPPSIPRPKKSIACNRRVDVAQPNTLLTLDILSV